ncbi:MAG: FRG domain-containing protein [Xanthobacteraceae bacterium]|nr:FRG domain-containing protein [Xanthobacteraceae bacterium]MCW5678722.1 FRG domain-containing protein [Xanthobacteraceae bacterium]
MNGQWMGRYIGSNFGQAILELDETDRGFQGAVYLYDDNTQLPGTAAAINAPKSQSTFQLKTPLLALDKSTDLGAWPQIASQYPGVTFPKSADSSWKVIGDKIEVDWTTDIGTTGKAELQKSTAHMPSFYTPPKQYTWDDFKTLAVSLEPYRFIFRGQEDSTWRLRTHFHRTGRADLVKFITQDIPALNKNLSNLTTHKFNLLDPVENGAFYSLVQHHGYPTPLLDWTHSPFIAAYFAYKNIRRRNIDDKHFVRIFLFDRQQWVTDFNQLQKLAPSLPHFSILDAMAFNNTRLVPQQAISSVTNVDDIEGYIYTRELQQSKKYLQVIDLPASIRKDVMQELSLMGITAGSLFPGLDGACEQLRERYFDL